MKRYFQYLIFFTFLLNACNESDEAIKPEKKDLVISVYASGKVKAKNQYNLYSNVNGIIKEIHKKEGDTLTVGDLLLTIENDNARLNKENSRIALKQAKENYSENSALLKELEYAVSTAKEKYTTDSVNYERYKNLLKKNVIPKSEFEAKQLAFQSSKNNYLSAKSKLKLTKQQLENELERARNLYLMNTKTTEDFEVKSLIGGKLYKLNKELGELVVTQEPIGIIGDSEEFKLEMQVDEADISSLNTGDEVIIKLDSYEDEVFKAELTRIIPSINDLTQTFTVEAEFKSQPKILYPGMNAEANIIINEKDDVLVIPRNYIDSDGYVYNKDGEKIKVETGLKNLKHIEILSGLDTESELILPE